MNRDTFSPPELNDALLARLPLFPLPNAVLFPHSVIPLHFFEPRYRVLAQHCVDGARVMAFGTLVDGDDGSERPAVHPIVTIGAIAAERRLPDGRWDIALKGLCRAEIVAEHPPTEPYRLVQVRRLRDRERADDRMRAADLRSSLVQVANLLPALWQQLNPLLMEARTPGALTDVAASLLVDDPERRRALLDELRVGQRIEQMQDAVARVMLELALRARDGRPTPPGERH
jgi:Lon protease-like protein